MAAEKTNEEVAVEALRFLASNGDPHIRLQAASTLLSITADKDSD